MFVCDLSFREYGRCRHFRLEWPASACGASANVAITLRGLSPAATSRSCSAARHYQSLGCTTGPQCDSNLPLGPYATLCTLGRETIQAASRVSTTATPVVTIKHVAIGGSIDKDVDEAT